jgi:hypothetical protein
VLATALVCFFTVQVPAAKADITYIFTGSGTYAGTDFTYTSSDFLTLPTTFIPTTSTPYQDTYGNSGPINYIEFLANGDGFFNYTNTSNDVNYFSGFGQVSSLDTPGLQNLYDGTLDIVTPEPSTAILWLTGIMLMILMRKRIAQLVGLDTGTLRSLSLHWATTASSAERIAQCA